MKSELTGEQKKILENEKKNLVVSASAGSGKTFVVIEFLIKLVCERKTPLSKILVLTFTKAAANEMRSRLFKAFLKQKPSPFLIEMLDEISISDISTIDSFCEKLIKRNISKLQIDENFKVLDERSSADLKLKAFLKTYDEMAQSDKEAFNDIYFSFKKNKEQIYQCLNSLLSFTDSLTKEQIQKIYNDENLPLLAEGYLSNLIKSYQQKGLNLLHSLGAIEGPWQEFKLALEEAFNFEGKDFWSYCLHFNLCPAPSLKRNKIDSELKEMFVKARSYLEKIMEITKNYTNMDNNQIERLRQNKLSKNILEMLRQFSQNYNDLKQKKDVLDFADLEKFTSTLLEDPNILASLQQKYSYIFIDEYQDTNTLQEGLLKPLAKNGNFVAVGDPKQGIYGFRNASMEIMNKDIKDFSSSEDGDALFLTGNFRSNKKILDFINSIFAVLMTEESAHIDYKNTSMLKGLVEFEQTSLPAVIVDICDSGKSEEEKLADVYSVKEDLLSSNSKNALEVKDIAYRIDGALNSEIYDAKLGKRRKVTEGDIAVLFRSRSPLMKDCVKCLQERGYSVLANVKDSLLDDGQIQVILSLLKLTLNLKDDISLASVMSSYLGGFTMGELVAFKGSKDKSFYENVLESKDNKVKEFFKMIENFNFDCQVLGLSKALKKLFNEKNYDIYINSLPDSITKNNNFNQLFKIIASGYEQNIPALITYLENVEISSASSPTSENAIIVTTIHATKGLEYPIVILAGSGESLSKVYNKPYIIEKEFGLGTYLYDFSDNTRIPSPIFLADKQIRRQKEEESELMIFYVALSRAQNSLIIIGSKSEKDLFDSVKDNYLSMIFKALGKKFAQKFDDNFSEPDYSFNIVKDVIFDERDSQNQRYITLSDHQKILDYIDYEYPYKNLCKINYKNSVTGILNLDEEHEKSLSSQASSSSSIDQGLAYHEALKILDFDKINSMQDLMAEIEKSASLFTENYLALIDYQILLKDILLLKEICKDKKLIKEREFIMSASLKELFGYQSENEVIVQGIIDLFSLDGDFLIDYKFTSTTNDEILIKRYKEQLKLYSLAIKKAFGREISKIYILSLKNAHLIELILI